MTDLNGQWMQSSEAADDAKVLITISTSEAEGMIRRWGVVSQAIGDLSVEAMLRGAVDDGVLDLLHSQRPEQHAREQEVTTKVKAILDSGYRVFVRDADDPIDSARADRIQARSLLKPGNPEQQTGAFYVLHLTVEPFGAVGLAARRDSAGAANASDALCHGMSATTSAPAMEQPAPVAAVAVAAADGNQNAPETHDDAGVELAAAATEEPQDTLAALGGYHVEEEATEPAMAAATENLQPDGVAESVGEILEAESPEPVAVSAAVEAPEDHDEAIALTEEVPAEAVVGQPKKYATKAEALTDQFRPKVAALDFRGLFAGNFGFQRDTVVDVTKLSVLSPQTISAYLMKANSLRQSGEHEKALSYYRVLLKSDPDNADYRFLYGKTLIEMGRIQPARECLERARELGHENAARELEQLDEREVKKPALGFLQFWRRAEAKR